MCSLVGWCECLRSTTLIRPSREIYLVVPTRSYRVILQYGRVTQSLELMKIIVQKPYSDLPGLASHAYVGWSGDGRRKVTFVSALTGKPIQSTSYARYLMSAHIGRFLFADEQVDHINMDRTDDRIANLRLLDGASNSARNARGRHSGIFDCAACGTRFTRELRLVSNPSRVCCTKSCARSIQRRRG